MKKVLTLLVGIAAAVLVAGASGQSVAPPASADMAAARIQKTLQARLPKIKIEKVQASQWPWLYEVITPDEMFYADATGDYLFYGKVMDTKTREDLTERRWNDLTRVDFTALPLNLAMKRVKGDGSRKLVVFADPHCPYCVQFEKTMQEVNNVTLYTFLFPLESIHPGATADAKRIWCTKDRDATWTEWMLNHKEPPPGADCNTAQLETLTKLGDKLKVTGTPTLIFEDGHRVPGAIPKDRLEEEFKAITPKS